MTERTPFSGGSGALPGGKAPRSLALAAAWVFLGLGVVVALAGLATGNLHPAALSMWAIGTAVGLAYALPPFRLAWRGWSEAINTGLIALVLPLYGFAVHTEILEWRVFVDCLLFALLIIVLILSTNWADREADAQVGKKTMATWLATRFTPIHSPLPTVAAMMVLMPLQLEAWMLAGG